jgi:ubiquitin-protein ligase E3 A
LGFGANQFGQAGHGDLRGRPFPVKVALPEDVAAVAVACGAEHSGCITADGAVWLWGNAEAGRCGAAVSPGAGHRPRAVNAVSATTKKRISFCSLALGRTHTALLSVGAVVYLLGGGDPEGRLRAAAGLAGVPVVAIAAGGDACVALSRAGEVFCFSGLQGSQQPAAAAARVVFPEGAGPMAAVRAGGGHFACISLDGRLFTWGRNHAGQTGLGISSPGQGVPAPRHVARLPGKVLDAACGEEHTLVLVDSGDPLCCSLHAMGRNASGALGLPGHPDDVLVPVALDPVRLHPEAPAPTAIALAAGGLASALVVQMTPWRPPRAHPPFLSLSTSPCHFSSHPVEGFLAALANPALMAGAFEGPASKDDLGLSGEAVERMWVELSGSPGLLQAAASAVLDGAQRVSSSWARHPCSHEAGLRWAAVALLSPVWGSAKFSQAYGELCLALTRGGFGPYCLGVFVKWLATRVPSALFGARLARALQEQLSAALSPGPPGETVIAICNLGVLLHKANRRGHLVPTAEFYNARLSAELDVVSDYIAFRQNAPFSFLGRAPFLLTVQAKHRLIVAEEALQKSVLTPIFGGLFGEVMLQLPPVVFAVRRTHLVQDTISNLVVHQNELKRPLQIHFNGEEGRDAGGVAREYFMLLVEELLSARYGMFAYHEDARVRWFAPQSFEDDSSFELCGRVLALSMYNSVLVDARLPTVLFRALLEPTAEAAAAMAFTMAEVAEVDPALARGVLSLRGLAPAVLESLDLRFELQHQGLGGEPISVELRPGGAQVKVEAGNLEAYLAEYPAAYLAPGPVRARIAAFWRGFHFIVDSQNQTSILRALELQPAELETIVAGESDLELAELKVKAAYSNIDPAGNVVRWFWEVLSEMQEPQDKRDFLQFVSGSDRAPVGGLKNLVLTLQGIKADEDHLPCAHTCFLTLDVPSYSSKEKMRCKLFQALRECKGGFGLV